jgi:hypothetical protein
MRCDCVVNAPGAQPLSKPAITMTDTPRRSQIA